MGALFSRVKTWVSTEDVTASDLNAEFNNILDNLVPLMLDDYSVNVAQMQVTADPGEVGTESLATTLAGEFARIRHILKEITGETQWYTSPDTSIATIANALGSGLSNNQIVSGRVRTTSQQPQFLIPNGAARTVTVQGLPTNLIYRIEGTNYTIASNVSLTSLTAAPSSNNTCLINDANAADQDWTKHTGEEGGEIPIDTAGTEITSLEGKLAAFSLNNGSTTEYFIGQVAGSGTKIIKARRGYFFDSTNAPVPRIVYSNNDTITLLKLSWIFGTILGALTVTYVPPTWSKDEPTSPATGDYWFDLDNQVWKRYDSTAFVDADATLLGVCVQDTTNTIGARSFEFFKNYEADNTVEIIYESATQIKSRFHGSQISSWGTMLKNEFGLFTWDITLDLDSGVVEAPSTRYFLYITEEGDKVISDVAPYNRIEDLRGYYHPHQSWRCVGSSFNNASSNFGEVISYFHRETAASMSNTIAANITVQVVNQVYPVNSASGTLTIVLPPAAYWRGQTHTYFKTSDDFNAVSFMPFTGQNIVSVTANNFTAIHTKGETLDLTSDGTDIYVTKRYIPSVWQNAGVVAITSTGSALTKNNAPTYDSFIWKREGSLLHGSHRYLQINAGAAGTGDYILNAVPVGLIINTTVHSIDTVVYGGPSSTVAANAAMFGKCVGIVKATKDAYGMLVAYNTVAVRYFFISDLDSGVMGAGYIGFASGQMGFSSDYRVTVSGWNE